MIHSYTFATCLIAIVSIAQTVAGDEPAIRVSDVTLFGDMDCFQVETPNATYVYGKRGAGLASIRDAAGNDWISYRHGGKSTGEYRGLPKCGQPIKYFHCGYGYGGYQNGNWFTSTVTLQQPNHIRIHSETKDGEAACEWDFLPNHATFTLSKIPGNRYWFIYEGTPGGALDAKEDFVIRPSGLQTPLTEPWKEVVPWVAFGAKESPHRLLLVNHQSNSPVDSYVSWPYKESPREPMNQMTVFGFGRPDWQDPKQHEPPMTGLPAKFSISFTTESDATSIDAISKKIKLQRDDLRSEIHESASPSIDVWYGDEQHFGRKGVPQKWVNILGIVSSPRKLVKALHSSLNGSD